MNNCSICTYSYFENKGEIRKKNQDTCTMPCEPENECNRKCLEDNDLCSIHSKNRYPVICLNKTCRKDACRVCYMKFFLSDSEDETRCMHCKNPFDIEFLLGEDHTGVQRFNNSFVWGMLKEHRETVLLDQIMARMPSFQPIATAELKIEKIKKKLTKLDKKIQELQIRRNEYNLDLVNQRFLIKNGTFPPNETNKDKDKFVTRGKCPKNGCNGFIEDSWKCGICETKICSQCMVSLNNAPHECNEEDQLSTKVIRETTKPCPACRIRIQRSSGCNQMFCTECHIFFNWVTGEQIRKTRWVHNIHHQEWVSAQVLQPGECGVLNVQKILSLKLGKTETDFLLYLFRQFNHIMEFAQEYVDPLEKRIRNKSVEYIKGICTKYELKIFVQRYYKASSKEALANLRRTMYADTLSDILHMTVNEVESAKSLSEKLVILEKCKTISANLLTYANNCMTTIGLIFNSSVPVITNNVFVH